MQRKRNGAIIGHKGSVYDNNGYWYVKVRLPGELKRREHIDRNSTPWVYRPPEHKNDWRGEWGQPRAILIGPRARAILSAHWGEATHGALFSPTEAFAEWLAAKRDPKVKPGGERGTGDYNKTIGDACARAGCAHFTANQLRHSFATEVRRKFGLEACRAALGHSMGASVTDRYSYAAIEDEMIAKASAAVEALW